jgi:phosphoserine phosphatase
MKALLLVFFISLPVLLPLRADLLPSWRPGPVKRALTSFIAQAETEGAEGYIEPEDRIAVFDNDGCLWSEKPFYFQFSFAVEKLREQAERQPHLLQTQPFKAVLEQDKETLATFGEHELLEVVMQTHAGSTEEAFTKEVQSWIKTARHPETGMLLTDMTFQPMLELIQALQAAGFKTYIVSGGGASFLRAWSQEIYGIPPEQVIGSRLQVDYQSGGSLIRQPKVDHINDKEGKPVGIAQHIGRRPVFAAGNSDGDFQMLEYVTHGPGARLGMLIHHTDDEREYAYDRDSSVGKLNRGLDEASGRGWILVDMSQEWATVYRQQKPANP